MLAAGARHGVEVVCAPAVAEDLEARVALLRALEERHGVPVRLHADPALAHDRFDVRKLAPAGRA
jgi:hypothetical protein